jgi:hypothetical protein
MLDLESDQSKTKRKSKNHQENASKDKKKGQDDDDNEANSNPIISANEATAKYYLTYSFGSKCDGKVNIERQIAGFLSINSQSTCPLIFNS